MSDLTITDLKADARELGVAWSDVVDCYRALRDIQRDRREMPNAIRQTAWGMAIGASSGCRPFWRHGFVARYGRRVERSDYTAVPGYDEIHQVIQSNFCHYTDDDGEYRLFEFLFSPYDRFPPAVELYAEALEMVAGEETEDSTLRRKDAEVLEFKFGANRDF